MRISVPPLADRRRESRFFSGLASVMAFVVCAALVQNHYLAETLPGQALRSAPQGVIALYDGVLAAWMILLVVQTTLVRKGLMNLHRSIGVGGMVLAILLLTLGAYGAIVAANYPAGWAGASVPPDVYLILPIVDFVLFGAYVAMAYTKRHGRKAHKRWIILATINLLGTAIAQILPTAWMEVSGFFLVFVFADIFIIAILLWDLQSLGRLHPVTLWGGLLLVASQPLRLAFAGTATWQAFADFATSLV